MRQFGLLDIGDIVSPLYYIELCDTVTLDLTVEELDEKDIGIIIDIQTHPQELEELYMTMYKILSSRSGRIGWICAVHVDKV